MVTLLLYFLLGSESTLSTPAYRTLTMIKHKQKKHIQDALTAMQADMDKLQVNQFMVLAKVLEQGFSEEIADRVMMQAGSLYHYQTLAKQGSL